MNKASKLITTPLDATTLETNPRNLEILPEDGLSPAISIPSWSQYSFMPVAANWSIFTIRREGGGISPTAYLLLAQSMKLWGTAMVFSREEKPTMAAS